MHSPWQQLLRGDLRGTLPNPKLNAQAFLKTQIFAPRAAASHVTASTSSSAVFQKGAGWMNSTVITTPTFDFDITLPRNCTLAEVTILTKGGAGGCTIDIWKSTFGSYPPVLGGTICGGSPPAIAAGVKYDNSTLAGWTTTFLAGDILLFHLSGVTVFTQIEITLKFT